MSESCLKLSMSKGFHNWTENLSHLVITHTPEQNYNPTFFYHTLSIVLISRPEAWLVLRFSYHILLISLCPAHQFSRKLLAMSICNLVSTKCYYCYHQFMEGLWQKKSCHAFKHLHHFQRLLNVGLTNAQNLQLELSRFSYTFYFSYPKKN